MAQPIELRHMGVSWMTVTFQSLEGRGRVRPRLHIALTAQTQREKIEVQILHLTASLFSNNELLGQGSIVGIGTHVSFNPSTLTVDIHLNAQAVRYVTECFRDHVLTLDLIFAGLLRVRDERPEAERSGAPKRTEVWELTPIPESPRMQIAIPRSHWVKAVLEPLGTGSYILMEMPVPKVPDQDRWTKALGHLAAAESHLHNGNDPGVFQSCHAVFESLEGAPIQIFDRVPDQYKRESLDALLAKAKAYFNAGRHTSKSGPHQGEFAVDHRDADFALAMAKMFLCYIARVLTETAP